MTPLKIVKRNTISVRDWDNFVEEVYGKFYSFQQQDGCKSRGVETINTAEEYIEDFQNTEIPFKVNGIKMGVCFQTWLNTKPEVTVQHFKYVWENKLFWNRNFYPHVSMIAKDLVEKGLLEPGEYDIIIDW